MSRISEMPIYLLGKPCKSSFYRNWRSFLQDWTSITSSPRLLDIQLSYII